MSTNVVNPSGEFPAKIWHLAAQVAVSKQTVRLEEMPLEANKWPKVWRFPGSAPIKTITVTGRDFTLSECQRWEIACQKIDDTVTVVVFTGESFTGMPTSFRRTPTDGCLLYDVELTLEIDAPEDPSSLSYT